MVLTAFLAVQFNANSKANHLGTYPGDASRGQSANAGTAAAAGAGAGAGVGGRIPSFKKVTLECCLPNSAATSWNCPATPLLRGSQAAEPATHSWASAAL